MTKSIYPAVLSGSVPTSNLRQEPSSARSININILSAGGTQNNQESDRQIPNSVLQFLRTLFPGGEIHVEDASLQETANSAVPENPGASTAPVEAESRITDDGIFFSNLLHEIWPIISQSGGAEPNVIPLGEAHTSEHQRPQDSSTQVSVIQLHFLQIFMPRVQ